MTKKIFSLGDTIAIKGINCVAKKFEYSSLLEGWSVVFDTPAGNELILALFYVEEALGV